VEKLNIKFNSELGKKKNNMMNGNKDVKGKDDEIHSLKNMIEDQNSKTNLLQFRLDQLKKELK